MGRLVKCQYCEEKVDKDTAYVYKKKNYHEKCFKQWEQEKADREKLYEYITKIYRIEMPTPFMMKQIKDYYEAGYKYKGMELSLNYFYDTLGNRPQDGQGLGIIPYVYEDAKNHYIKQRKIADSVNTKTHEELTVEIDTNTKRKKNLIDIDSI